MSGFAPWEADGPPLSAGVAAHRCRREWVRRLEDALACGCPRHYCFHADEDAAQRAWHRMAAEPGWEERRRRAEPDCYAGFTASSAPAEMSRLS